jgi:hypothetical protein
MAVRDRDEEEPQTFAWPLIGALYASLVIVAVIAILETHLGRHLENEVGAPARSLIAVPVVAAAAVVFVASMLALIVPGYRRQFLRVAEIAAWLIPAWLIMGAMVLGAIDFAINHAG